MFIDSHCHINFPELANNLYAIANFSKTLASLRSDASFYDTVTIRESLEDSLRQLLPGNDNTFGNPRKLAEILGLQDT